MTYDVVVVGGGIGGLTVAALLAARGLKVCLFERQSQVGGCVARVEFSDYEFDPGMGLYTSFGEGEVYQQLFSELKVSPPNTTPTESEYVVRLVGDADVRLHRNQARFEAEMSRVFPECGSSAIEFYKRVAEINELRTQPSRPENRGVIANLFRRRASVDDAGKSLEQSKRTSVNDLLVETSPRFRRFIDSQLRSFIQTGVQVCDLFSAALALCQPLKPAYEIEGGPAAIAEHLSEAIRSAGGTVRLNTSVLRIAWDTSGRAVGVDLLSGETVHASKAIISNMTIWDTYGKLVGLNRTPPEIKTRLAALNSGGVYLIYATLESLALSRLPANSFLVAEEDEANNFTFATQKSTSRSNHSVTIKTNCEVEPWFAYQSSEEEADERDQEMLEKLWIRVHRALPELGDAIEVIETTNPRNYYELTRRKLGKLMGHERSPLSTPLTESTTVPNLFVVGDTVSAFPFLDSIVDSALSLANRLAK